MTWAIMVIAGLITVLIRLSFILWLGQRPISPWLQRGLRFVPPAVLSAIILPEMFIRQGQFDLSLDNPRWLAGLLAGWVAWRTRNAILTILAGMLALWLLQFLI